MAVRRISTAEDDEWVLTGEKRFVCDGGRAEEMVVAARLPGSAGDAGIALFVVPQSAIEAEPMANLDGSRNYATVVVDSVRVGAERVLGEPGDMGGVLRGVVQGATAELA